MKWLFLMGLFLSISANASIQTDVYFEGEKVFQFSYFKDSSFWVPRYSSQFCYRGNIKDVCASMKADVRELQQDYANGAHDNIELISCQAGVEMVNVKYILNDDYAASDIKKSETIKPCQ